VITEKELHENIDVYGDKTFVVSYPVKPVADEIRKRLIKDIGIAEDKICMGIYVYHKYEDFVTLADLVLKMHPDYRISYRHYGFDDLETVMYVE